MGGTLDEDDVIELLCAGRLGVDLYAEQEGVPLRDVESFRRYLGGSAANICVGVARLGLRSAMCSRVGDEDLGRFLSSSLEQEGIDCSLLQWDSIRPSGLVTLALYELEDFPRIFFYRDSADLATDPGEVDIEALRRVETVLLTGSYLTSERLVELSRLLATGVKSSGGRVVLDIDYRPVLFGLVPVGQGNEMSATAAEIAATYRMVLPFCDLVVGTEAELRVAGGSPELEEAMASIRELTDATLVLKRGAQGAVAYEGAIPAGLAGGVSSPAFGVVVRNTVGAGDGFMSGFLSGWLRDEPLAECLRLGNAAGALVAARHGCTPAMPFADELQRFLEVGGVEHPDEDEEIERRHRLGSRAPTPDQLCILAIDHRWQLEELADACGAPRSRIAPLKDLLGDAFLAVARGRPDAGILVDARYGASVLERVAGSGAFVLRTMDVARSRPLELVCGDEAEAALRTWSPRTIVKANAYLHPTDPRELMAAQTATLARLTTACRAAGRELLVEIQPPSGASYGRDDLPALVATCYHAGVLPQWWKLPPSRDPAVWHELGELVRGKDPTCRGLLVLGSTVSEGELAAAFDAAAAEPSCKGFAIGRGIFIGPAEAWLRDELSDADLVEEVASRYAGTIRSWEAARSRASESPSRASGSAVV